MDSPIKKIIISIDFSDGSLNALHTAIQMCKRHSAELHLLYVMDASQIFPIEGMLSPIAGYNEELMEKDLRLLEQLAQSVRPQHQVQCFCHHKIGFPVESLCQAAKELDCDLVVVPSPDQKEGPGYLFDSIAYRVLKGVGCSVLTVPEGTQLSSFKKILFPLRRGADAAGKYGFSKTIIQKNSAVVAIVGLHRSTAREHIAEVKELHDQAVTWMEADGFEHVLGTVRNEESAAALADLSKKVGAQLVIINASTKRSLMQFFLGNYTQRMLRSQEFAVLCYQPKSRNKPKAAPEPNKLEKAYLELLEMNKLKIDPL